MTAIRTMALAFVLGLATIAPARAASAVAQDASVASFEGEIAAAKAAMMADPDIALQHARTAGSLSASAGGIDPALAFATARWLEGEALRRLGRLEEALPIIEETLATVERIAPGSKLNGDLLMSRAGLAGLTGHAAEALQGFQEAYKIFQAVGAARSQAIALQNIGSIYSDAGDYQRVLDYYEQSAEVYSDDPALSLAAHNNRGTAFKELGDYARAEDEFRQALAIAKEIDSALLQVGIMTNIASTQYLRGDRAAADATALAGLELAKDGPAAGEAPFLWGVRAQIALADGEAAHAADYIGRTFNGLDLAATTMPFRDFHKSAYDIFKLRADPGRALQHLEAYKRLDDEARSVAASTTAALMGAQFDYANQQLRISTLKESQLEKDQELAHSQAVYRATIVLGVLGAAIIIAALSLISLVKIRRSHNETRAANVHLNVANNALEKAVRARTEFLAMTSHEIRTPLNGIMGMTQVMLMDPALTGDMRSNVELVHGAGQTMKALVDDILDVSKMETGKLTLETRGFELKTALGEIGALSKAQGEAKGLSVGIELGACPARWVGDEQRIRQIAFNLMSNAVKFTERGTVTLIAAAEDGALRLSVKDTGIGIPAEHIHRIFESFQQVDATISRRYGGTGLGLAICSNLARAMGGEIAVSSEPGQGSTFTITIPLPAADGASAADVAASDPGTNNVLLADGNLLRQSLAAAHLRKAGFEVSEADTAADADSAIATHQFAAVIVCGVLIETHTLDGLLRVRALRAAQPGARLIVLADDAARSALIGCGADVVAPLTTPPHDLAALVRGAEAAAGPPVEPGVQPAMRAPDAAAA